MPKSQMAALLSHYELPASFIYLAPLFPLVRAMWADRSNQLKEQQIIRKELHKHSQALSEEVGGMEVIPAHELQWFIRDFIEQEPDDGLLRDLTRLSLELVAERQSAPEPVSPELFQTEALLHTALEIVAACLVDYGAYTDADTAERIAKQERNFVRELFKALDHQRGA